MTSTPRRTLADAVRRPAPAALIEGVPDRSPTSLAAAPALAPETFDPVRAIATLGDMRAAIDATTDPRELLEMSRKTAYHLSSMRGQRPCAALRPFGRLSATVCSPTIFGSMTTKFTRRATCVVSTGLQRTAHT